MVGKVGGSVGYFLIRSCIYCVDVGVALEADWA